MGIHASPTCVLAFGDKGGAEGFLVGKPNEGLAAMFTMMNYMRLGVGVQGVGLADRSYQAVGDLRARARAGPRAGREGPGRDHPPPGRAAHAAADAFAHPGKPRRLLLHGRVPRSRRARHGRRSRGLLPGASRPADADRQGLVHRGRAGGDRARHPGPRRHGLRRGDRRRAVLPRRAHRADLRRHQLRSRRSTSSAASCCATVARPCRRSSPTCASVDAPLANAGDDFAVRAQRARPRAGRAGAVLDQHADRREARPGAGRGGRPSTT